MSWREALLSIADDMDNDASDFADDLFTRVMHMYSRMLRAIVQSTAPAEPQKADWEGDIIMPEGMSIPPSAKSSIAKRLEQAAKGELPEQQKQARVQETQSTIMVEIVQSEDQEEPGVMIEAPGNMPAGAFTPIGGFIHQLSADRKRLVNTHKPAPFPPLS